MERGKFIVIEGIDGSGKSSLARLIGDQLNSKGIDNHVTSEPTDNPVGSIIRQVLTHKLTMGEKTIAALFLADRIDHVQNPIYGMLNYLDQGIHVISDRYYLSTFAYHVPHVSLDWLIDAHSICMDMLRPDLTLFIDVTVEESLKRIKLNRPNSDLFETNERLTQVNENYKCAIAKIKNDENIAIIDGMHNQEIVLKNCMMHVNALLS